jgi:hypothetical protein
MKSISRLFLILSVISSTVFLSNCGSDEDENKVELQKLSKTWELVSATLDGGEAGQILESFTLTFGNDYSYQITGTEFPSPWAESGTWSFVSTNGDTGTIKREDDVLVHYSIASNGQLTLSFSFTDEGYPGARTSAIGGDWILVLE